MMASKKNGTLYIGVTNDPARRVWEHKHNVIQGFIQKYNIHKLVWFEETSDITAAIVREKQMKKWRRQWKIDLIEKINPEWVDLYDEICA